ncbi:transcription factor Ouib-like isoform X1 [Drosophila sulfurigaster albostrigata]|uniref:transcription factor Ouib-like isoform X1 n=1 Tax=Drosophila sulfurigaster albostrigata TaxID=89887 RepID=UPI002D21AD53|nr:transcription factor Ouib-like isoform X1 [Drosophila sulfurigaster albostrigata]
MSMQCRMCAEKIFNPNTKNLFDDDGDEIVLNIETLTGILLREDIHMPNYICGCCHLDLCHAIAFRERCLQTEQSFQQRKLERMRLTVSNRGFPRESMLSSPKANPSHSVAHRHQTQKPPLPKEKLFTKDKYSKVNTPVAATPMGLKPLNSWSNSDDNLSSSCDDVNDWSADEASSEAPVPQQLPSTDGDVDAKVKLTEPTESVDKTKNKTTNKKDDKLDKFICELCGLQSNSIANHELHMRRHRGEKNFKCEECGSKHYSKYLMRLHIRVKHEGEKPFACKFCDERFHSGSTRIRHERVRHIRDWAFECKICGKKYLTKSCLNKHKFLHTGLRPYRCDLCNVAFPRRPGLRIHCRTKQHQKRASEAHINPNDVLNAAPTVVSNDETNVANEAIPFPDSLLAELDV